jgi:FPC/CPF motif-containing protein YcgG
VVAAFERRLADDGYPCDFGVRAQRAGDNAYAALDRRDPVRYGVAGLAATLDDFKLRARTGPPRQSLIVFDGPPHAAGSPGPGGPPGPSGPVRGVRHATEAPGPSGSLPPVAASGPSGRLARDRERFWELLSGLSRLDGHGRPEEVPGDPRDPRWQWCFGGEPWFVFALSPGYAHRRSRRAGPCLTLVFQTRRVFTGLGGATPAGQAAKRRIRAALRAYDGSPPHPHLGDPGGSSTYKWRQYVLPDDQTILPEDGCPFRGHRADTTGELS